MKKLLLLTYFFFTLSTVFASSGKFHHVVYDFSCFNFREKSLAGQWEFYWHRLLTPQDFKNNHGLSGRLIPVPKSWIAIDGLSSTGYGTYRITVILPQKKKLYALKLIDVFSAYRLWINDSLYLAYGRVGKTRKEEIPKRGTQIVNFYAPTDTVQIIIQVSNHHHRNGGIAKAPILGQAPHINNTFLGKSISVFFIFGAFIIFAIYLLWLYNYTRKNFDALLLGISILLAGIYTLFNDDFLIMQIFPNLGWEVVHKVNFLTNYLKIFFLFAFFYLVLKRYMPDFFNGLLKVALAILLLLSLVVLVTPTEVFSHTLSMFIVLLAILAIYVIVGYIRRINYSDNKMIMIPFASIILLAIFTLNDVLYEYQVIRSVYLTDFGLFIFIAAQAILISEKQINTYNRAEKLTRYFQKLNNVKRLLGQVHFDNLLDLIRILKKSFDADVVAYYSIENQKIYINALIDNRHEKEFSQKVEIKKGEKEINQILYDFLELAVHSNQAFFISDKNNLYRLIKKKLSLKFKSILLTTIGVKDNPLGIIYLENQHSYFTKDDEKLLNLISPQIASVINNVNIFRHLENLNKNLMKIVQQRTKKIETRNKELELRNFDLDEKVEELRITAEIINSMNEEIKAQQEILENKNKMLSEQTKSLDKQKAIIEELNKQIRESVQYAYRIQYALLNSPYNRPASKEHFIITKSGEPVAGNFWWYSQLNDFEIFAFGQSEYSGIKGAFVSLLSFSLMNEMSYKCLINKKYEDIKPDDFISAFKSEVFKYLESTNIEISVVFYRPGTGEIKTSTLDNFLYIVDDKLIQLSPGGKDGQVYHVEENSYFVGFTNNFVKLLIDKKHIVKMEEIKDFVSNLSQLSSLKEMKTFFENYLYGVQDMDILIIGMKLK